MSEEDELQEALAAATAETSSVGASAVSGTSDSTAEDEEVRLAKAMAMAIQTNPNLSPEEIHKLVSSQSPSARGIAPSSVDGGMLIPGRLTDMIKGKEGDHSSSENQHHDVAPGASDHSKSDKEKKSGMKSNLKLIQQQFKHGTATAKGKFMDITGAKSISSALPKSLTFTTKKSSKDKATAGLEEDHLDNQATHFSYPSEETGVGEGTTTANMSSSNEQRDSIVITGGPIYEDKDAKVQLTEVVWKRRSGLGKYSASSAWERRRMILRGNKIYYYKTDEDAREHSTNHDSGTNISPTHSRDNELDGLMGMDGPVSPGAAAGGNSSKTTLTMFDGTTLKKNLMELTYGWSATGTAAENDHDAPRGCLDLVKEKALVAATSGHSGAPSPFAISIKVKNETKWKLCFMTHKTQMEWLTALSDVVVQASVDQYNTQLVDYSNPVAEGIFHPVHVNEPPRNTSNESSAGGHRLWMMEKYAIHVIDKEEGDDDDDDDRSQITTNTVDDFSMDHSQRPNTIRSITFSSNSERTRATAKKSNQIDETLYWVGIVWNLSVMLSRTLSESPKKFMYFVTIFNLIMVVYFDKVGIKRGLETLIGKNSLLDFIIGDDDKLEEGSASASRSGLVGDSSGPVTPDKRTTAAKQKSAKKIPKTPIPEGYKPMAGNSTILIEKPTDLAVNKKNQEFAGWRDISGSNLAVRSHGYMATKAKVPSPGELYKCSYVDIFESPSRYPEMATRVHLPKVAFENDDGPKTWTSPDIFIVSIALPTDPPKLGRTSSDGGGYTITCYFTMHQDTRDILRRVTAEGYDPSQEPAVDDIQKSKVNAVRLFEAWCRDAPNDHKMQTRFKLVPNSANLEEIGMPSWIGKYNGKPVLIKRPGQTGFLYSFPELSCMEFDVSLHVFPYLAKQAFCYMKEAFFKKIIVAFGFVIEGRDDDELPECVIGLMQLCYPNPLNAIQADEFFAGTAPKAFETTEGHSIEKKVKKL